MIAQTNCAWCKSPTPVLDMTWFRAKVEDESVRLCHFCYENAKEASKLKPKKDHGVSVTLELLVT